MLLSPLGSPAWLAVDHRLETSHLPLAMRIYSAPYGRTGKVVMIGSSIEVGGDHHLEVRELPLGKFQADGVGLLGRDVILCGEGLDEVVELCPVSFAETLLGHLHLNEGGLWNTVAAGDQPRVTQARFFSCST